MLRVCCLVAIGNSENETWWREALQPPISSRPQEAERQTAGNKLHHTLQEEGSGKCGQAPVIPILL